MSALVPHPRRRSTRPAGSSSMTPALLDAFDNMSLRKGDTFHAPTASAVSNDFWDPLESRSCSPPGRSTTCPNALEDLLLGAGERRAAELLSKVDRAVEVKSKLAISSILTEPDVLPAPDFPANDTTTPSSSTQRADPARKATRHRHSHASDSGIGSSISDSEESGTTTAKTSETVHSSPSNQSLSSISAATEQRGLSKYASDQIHKYIVKPILREDALKDFHPLIEHVPDRIGNKEIRSLRDLEKTLIFLAPEYSRSPSKYLQFCERAVRVLHTTVTTLHESDQRAPTDRPYTQGYFFDLVEQIRRYATILAATREKQSKGEKLDEMDYSPDESVSLVGGMSHNGKPAELVRHKDGKSISVATGQPLSSEELASASMKRPMSDEFDNELDDDVLRSMARRKKNAKPEIHPCSLCDKEFKRPCDLTKHYKTHERPWKCPDPKCKYHDHGWPTEKERDRHVNDKHSNAPTLYHCLYAPCPYTSKRESNCKQHMEKAHGWEYVRSKNNGKGRVLIPRLAQGSVPQSPASSLLTPLTPIAPSPSVQSWSGSSRSESMAPPPPAAGPSNWATPNFTDSSFADHFNFDFNNMAAFPMTPALSDERRPSSSAGYSSVSGGLQLDGSTFDDSVSPDDITFDHNFTFGPNDFSFQQATPNSTTGPSSSSNSAVIPHVSPNAQLEQTFNNNYYEDMNLDGGIAAGSSASGPNEDFTLFGGNAPTSNGGEMFPSLPEGATWGSFGGQFDSTNPPQFSTGHSTLDDLFPELKGH